MFGFDRLALIKKRLQSAGLLACVLLFFFLFVYCGFRIWTVCFSGTPSAFISCALLRKSSWCANKLTVTLFIVAMCYRTGATSLFDDFPLDSSWVWVYLLRIQAVPWFEWIISLIEFTQLWNSCGKNQQVNKNSIVTRGWSFEIIDRCSFITRHLVSHAVAYKYLSPIWILGKSIKYG